MSQPTNPAPVQHADKISAEIDGLVDVLGQVAAEVLPHRAGVIGLQLQAIKTKQLARIADALERIASR